MTTFRLFFYYAVRSVINQIKRLFKTWVLIFLIVCFGIGVLIGFAGEAFSEELGESTEQTEYVQESEEDEVFADISFTAHQAGCAIASALSLIMFMFAAVQSEKSSCSVFTQADVNLLFASPMKPQSVLLFKTLCKLGGSVAACIYLIFQIPNAIVDMHLSVFTVLGVIAAFMFLLIYTNIIQVFLFTAQSSNRKLKGKIKPITYILFGLVAVGFLLYFKSGTAPVLDAAVYYFSSDCIEYIPVFGWIFGMFKSAIYSDYLMFCIYTAIIILSLVLAVKLTWSLKADFYEDAMQKSEETAELMRGAEEGRATKSANKKDRSDKLNRDGLSRGEGANVYLFKSLYNRFRFAHFGVFTKTSETYLVFAVIISLVLKLSFKTTSFVPVGLVLAALAFFRSLGNPISKDLELSYFTMIPEKASAKIFFSTLAGAVDCLLDLIPAMLVSTLILGSNPLNTAAWMLFVATVDFYSSGVTTFIDLSVSVSLSKQIKAVIAIMFIYFGLLPNIAILLLGLVFDKFALFTVICALFSFGVGLLFSFFSALLLERGRK